ncbi:MAG: protein kinase [Planctomycetota bacterium]|nr:protein kinase [Planctomycetota bacterium]
MSSNDLHDLSIPKTAGLFARYLRAQQIIDEARLRHAWSIFNERGGHYGSILVQLGYISQAQISEQLGRMQIAAASLSASDPSLADTSRVSNGAAQSIRPSQTNNFGPRSTSNFGPRSTINFGPALNTPAAQSSSTPPISPPQAGRYLTSSSSQMLPAAQSTPSGHHQSLNSTPHPQTGRFQSSHLIPSNISGDGEQTLAVSGEFIAAQRGSTPGSAITPQFVSGDGDQTLAVSGDWQGQSSHYIAHGSQSGVLVGQSGEAVDFTKILSEKYEFLGELSRGGMGVIYRVVERKSGKEQALKVILNKDFNPTEFHRFQLEARVLAHIEHRNIIRIHETGKEVDKPFFTMELIKGGDLKARVDKSLRENGAVPSFYWTAEVMLALASGLAHCHEKGVVHRDFKPANVLIEEESSRPVIIDFGLVKRDSNKLKENFESLADDLTKTGQMLGTPAYMAPEQVDNKGSFGDIGPAADVWGFGATLFYCLTGEPPYKGETIVNILKQLMTAEPPRASTLNPEVPEWLDELCANCLKHKQAERFTMEVISDSLFVPLKTWKKSRGAWQKKLKWVAASIFSLIMVSVAAYFLSGPGEPPRTPSVDIKPASLTQRLTIQGTVGPNAETVYIGVNDQSSPRQIPIEGRKFSSRVKLARGENSIIVYAENSVGKSIKFRSTVFFDTEKPSLTIEPYPSQTLESKIVIQGTVSEPCKLNGLSLDTQEVNGQFKVTLELKEENGTNGLFKFPITVTDRVGLNTTEVITIQKLPTFRVDPDDFEAKNSFKTLTEAIREAIPGTRIILAPGIYQGPFAIDKDLEIVSQSEDRTDVILRSPVNNDRAPCLEFYGLRGYFRNLTFVGYSEQGNLHAVLISRGQVTFENCIIRCPKGRGIAVTRTMNAAADKELNVKVTLRNSLIEKCDYAGVIIDKGAEIVIDRCQFRGVKHYGLRIGHNSKGTISNSSFKGSIVGLYVTEFTNVEVDNCKFRRCTEGAIIEKSCRVTLNNSEFTDNGSGLYTTHESVVTAKNCRFNKNRDFGANADRAAKFIGIDSFFIGNGKYGVFVERGKEYKKDILKGTSVPTPGDPAFAELTRCQFGSNGRANKKHDEDSTITVK